MMRLIVQNGVEALVDLLRGRFQLRQMLCMRIDGGQRTFVAHLEVHVDHFVRKGGELIAKAHRMHAVFGGDELVRVELCALLLVENDLVRSLDDDVNIVLSAGHHLIGSTGRDRIKSNDDCNMVAINGAYLILHNDRLVLLDVLVEAFARTVGQIERQLHASNALRHQ